MFPISKWNMIIQTPANIINPQKFTSHQSNKTISNTKTWQATRHQHVLIKKRGDLSYPGEKYHSLPMDDVWLGLFVCFPDLSGVNPTLSIGHADHKFDYNPPFRPAGAHGGWSVCSTIILALVKWVWIHRWRWPLILTLFRTRL